MRNYINVERCASEIKELLCTERNGWYDYEPDAPIRMADFLEENFSDDYIEEYAWEKAISMNADMKEYLHGEHKIWGNFCNIDYNYNSLLANYLPNIDGKIEYDTPAVEEMISRLDAGEQSERANIDRNIMLDFIWEACGTFGIKYNFNEYVSEVLYAYEEEYEEEFEAKFA